MNLTDIEDHTKQLEAQTAQLKEKLVTELLALPGNPRITPIGTSGKCFTIKMSDMGLKNWTPFYHNFDAQYKQLAEIVQNSTVGTLCKKLEGIIEKESYREQNYTYHFHPDVIKHLADMLGVEKEATHAG